MASTMPSFKRTRTREKQCRILGVPVFGKVEKRTEEAKFSGSDEKRTNKRTSLRQRGVRMAVAKCLTWVMSRVMLGVILFGFSG